MKAFYPNGECIIDGDFNAIKNSSERKGRLGREVENGVDLFCKFIVDCDLMDVLCKEKKYLWFSGNGRDMSRIDRLLVSNVIANR